MRGRRIARALPILMLVTACTSTPRAVQTPSPLPTPSPTPVPSVVRPRPYDPDRALAFARMLAGLGPREASGAGYREAAERVREAFVAAGYRARVQSFAVRAGYTVVEPGGRHAPVPAGRSVNVIAEPSGFDPRRPFVVVGAHLDSVPESPGANDNASGVGVIMELARALAARPARLPIVFVAFGAEERRRQSSSQSQFAAGSFAYVDALPRGARVRAMLNVDMVGAGDRVELLGTDDLITRALTLARDERVPARRRSSFFYSDHLPFTTAGIPALWLWTGDHPSFHSPADDGDVLERLAFARVGRLATAFLRALR
jgi:hypothetical protein